MVLMKPMMNIEDLQSLTRREIDGLREFIVPPSSWVWNALFDQFFPWFGENYDAFTAFDVAL